MGAECVCVCVCRVCVHVQKNIRETQARLVAVCSSILCVSPAAFFYPVPLCLLYPIQFNASQRRLCGFSGLLLLWRDETLLLDRSCRNKDRKLEPGGRGWRGTVRGMTAVMIWCNLTSTDGAEQTICETKQFKQRQKRRL